MDDRYYMLLPVIYTSTSQMINYKISTLTQKHERIEGYALNFTPFILE